MTSPEVLEALCSGDNHKAWQGAWNITQARNDVLDAEFLPHLPAIRTACIALPVPSPPTLRDSRDIVKTAVNILDFRAKNICRCQIYTSTDQLLPESQSKFGLVKIFSKVGVDYTYEFTCACAFCEQDFRVSEYHGYHYPWAAWDRL